MIMGVSAAVGTAHFFLLLTDLDSKNQWCCWLMLWQLIQQLYLAYEGVLIPDQNTLTGNLKVK